MIATQGEGGQPIATFIKTLIIRYSLDNTQWYNVTADGTGTGPPQVASSLLLFFIDLISSFVNKSNEGGLPRRETYS